MSVVTPTILCGGAPMDPAVQLGSIDIVREVNKIPLAELRLFDGDAASREFSISESGFFDLGAEIEIKLRYEGEPDVTVFKGVVVRQGIEATGKGSMLVVGLKDVAVKLTAARRSAVFERKTDDAIVRQILDDAGLSIGALTATLPEHQEMVQYRSTAWDFLLSRAEAQGMLVVVDDGAVSLLPMALSGGAAHRFEYGMSQILEIELSADAGDQYAGIESVAWDLREGAATEPSAAEDKRLSPGDLDGASLGQALGNGTATLAHIVPAAPEELRAWADATMARSRMALVRGRIAVPGDPAIKLMDVIEVAGIGRRYNGTALATGVRHRVGARGFRTDVMLGLAPERLSRRDGVLETPAAGLLPAVSGLQIGVVAPYEDDPDNELRVRVLLPSVDPSSGLVWARLASPDAGNGRGYYFRPEPGDEVVVGFLNDDPRHPVILGALYGSKNAPAQAMGTPSESNPTKGIVTKKGTTIGFSDGDRAIVFVETANGNKLLLDDDAETVSLSDQHGNSIAMSRDGIVLTSASNLTIDAASAVEIKGATVDVK